MADSKQEVGTVRYEWTALEFPRVERTRVWYLVAGLVGLGLLAYTIYTRQWAGTAVVLMISVVVYLMGRVTPRTFIHRLTSRGVEVGDKFYPYTQLRAFWVVNTPSSRTLNLISAKKFSLLLTLQLEGADVEKVREVLLEFLPEEPGRGEDVIDRVGRFFRF